MDVCVDTCVLKAYGRAHEQLTHCARRTVHDVAVGVGIGISVDGFSIGVYGVCRESVDYVHLLLAARV